MKAKTCPECGTKMHKAGPAISGRHEVQKYRCPKCFRTQIDSSEAYIRPTNTNPTNTQL